MNIATQIRGASKPVLRAVTEVGGVESVQIAGAFSVEGSWEATGFEKPSERFGCFLRLVKTTTSGREEVVSARGWGRSSHVAALMALATLSSKIEDAARITELLADVGEVTS